MDSTDVISSNNLSVISAAALYTKNAAIGGSKLKSISCVPNEKGSTMLNIVDREEMRDVVATELQVSVTPARRGTLLPFSNARRRALFHF